jgi:hypothetical protein
MQPLWGIWCGCYYRTFSKADNYQQFCDSQMEVFTSFSAIRRFGRSPFPYSTHVQEVIRYQTISLYALKNDVLVAAGIKPAWIHGMHSAHIHRFELLSLSNGSRYNAVEKSWEKSRATVFESLGNNAN